MIRPAASLSLLLALTPLCSAQGTRLLRQPTISDTQVAFTYANDLWVVGRDGGDGLRLTSFPGTESDPCFSPDWSLVAEPDPPVHSGRPGKVRW